MKLSSTSDVFQARRERLRLLLEKRGLSLLLVTKPVNLFYLTGFRGSAGVAAIRAEEALLWVDPRYTVQAQEQAGGVEVVEEKGGLLTAVSRWLRRERPGRVGFDDAALSVAQYEELKGEGGARQRLESAGGLVEELRFVKDPGEIQLIRKAARVTVAAFERILGHIRPGVRESDLAAEIEYSMRRMGAEGAAFETIVASGERSALPHARASAKLLEKNELVVFDLGAILAGYAADMTRTIYLGRPSRRVRSLHKAVLEAQERAIEALRPGSRAGVVDAAARRVLGRYGLAKYFTHSTGHGVGLEIHEKPRLGRGEKTLLQPGCVVTAEPGVYLRGFGGLRIEDTVLVGEPGPEVLTPAPKDRWFLS